jgi:NAD(P)-dependent dehydrogenase (short-subunit alcohol dehydrogenase family)
VALVTGAGDRGLGGAIAERLAREGAAVVLGSRREPARLLRRLRKQKREVVWTSTDVASTDDVQRLIDSGMEEFGKIDVVVNNAGIEVTGPLTRLRDEDWQRLCDVNLSGVLRVTRAALPYLPQPGGVIVNIASALALGGCAGIAAYSATKAGVIGLTQALAFELAPQGIRAVAVAPALVATAMAWRQAAHLTEDVWDKVEACHPLGVGLPEDVASAVAFLASDEARWITGVTLPLGWAPSFALPVAST